MTFLAIFKKDLSVDRAMTGAVKCQGWGVSFDWIADKLFQNKNFSSPRASD